MEHGTSKAERPIPESEPQRGLIERRAARYGMA